MYRIWDKSKPPTGPFALNRDAPQAQGLVAWWPMGGPSSRVFAPDLAGNSHLIPGTAPGSATLNSVGAPALEFTSASSQYLKADRTLAMPLTLASWFAQTTDAIAIPIGVSNASDNFQRAVLITLNAVNGSLVRAQIQDAAGNAVFAATSAPIVLGALQHGVAVFGSSTSRAIYLNGALGGTDTTSRNPSFSRVSIGSAANGSTPGAIVYGSFFPGSIGESALWNIALDASTVRRLYDPGTRFELWYPLRSRKWMVSAGGGSYSAAITESAAAADAATAAYIATASVSESITAADSLAAATTWVRSLTEAASVADALTSAVTWARALTEAASASDLATAIVHAVAALTEAATASDSQATGSIYTGSLTEAASVSDALTAAATLVALLTEVATASDAATSAATWVRLLTEPATAVDSVAGAQGATYTASVTEVLAATELLVAVLAAQGVISAPPLGHGLGMSRRVTQAGRSRPANLNDRTR